MATAEQIRAETARRLRRALVGLAGTALLVAAGVVWLVVAGPAAGGGHADELERSTGPSTVPPPDSVSLDSAPPAEGFPSWVAPARWVQLPPGGRLVEEFPVGFPHTPAGAAAVAVAAVTYGWTADPATASRVAGVYTAPEYAAGSAQRAADAALAWRVRLGAPPSGPLPAQVGVSARPVGVQWRPRGRDRVRVSVLAELREYRAGEDSIRISVVAITADLVWTADDSGGDWMLVPSNGPLPTPAPQRLGTAGFNDAGWVAIGQSR